MKWVGNRESDNIEDRRDGLGGGGAPTEQAAQPGHAQHPPVDDRMGKFVSTVLADTEDVWKNLVTKNGSVKACDTFSARNLCNQSKQLRIAFLSVISLYSPINTGVSSY